MMDKIEEVKRILEEFGEQVRQTVETPDITFVMVVARLTTARNKAAKEICQLFEKERDRPTYLRAAIEDWRNERISLERLCEIWHVSFYDACYALSFRSQPVGGRSKHPEAIEKVLEEILRAK